MIKRLSLLLAAMFAFSIMFAAPVFASGDDWNNGDDNGCVVHDDHGDHWWSNGNHDDDDWSCNCNHDDHWWCDHNGDDWDGDDHHGDDWS